MPTHPLEIDRYECCQAPAGGDHDDDCPAYPAEPARCICPSEMAAPKRWDCPIHGTAQAGKAFDTEMVRSMQESVDVGLITPEQYQQVMGVGPRPTGDFARQVAQEAIGLFTGDRNATYGDATDNFQDIGDLWAVVFGHPVSAEQVAICSALIKVARLKASPNHDDTWVDATAYLALGAGINRRRRTPQ